MALDALAQAFPSKAIELIVPFPAGGSADIVARLMGQHMTQRGGQPVIVRPLIPEHSLPYESRRLDESA